MTDQLISFETAKLAYDKGFKENTSLSYATEDSYKKILNHVHAGIPAPTQSLLQKWLREVHNVHVWVTYNYPINGKYVYVLMFRNSIETFNSYEEALEQGLIEALKLIKV